MCAPPQQGHGGRRWDIQYYRYVERIRRTELRNGPERRFNIDELALNRTARRCTALSRAAVQFRGTCQKDIRHPVTWWGCRGSLGGNRSSFHPFPPKISALCPLSQQPLCACTASPEQHFTDPLIPLLVPAQFKSLPPFPPSHGTASPGPAFSI